MSSKGPPAVAASKQVNDMISSIRATPDGQSISLKVQRQGTVQDVQVQPKRTDLTAPQTIGVMLQPNFKEIQKIQSKDIGQAAKLAYEYWNQIFTQTLNGILGLFKMLIMGQSTGQSVSGPIGLIKTGTQVVSTQDWTAVLLFAAALSVNLGVINALPLPALDGGQLAFVLAEALTGKKIDQRLQEGITSVAVLFLLLVSISTAFSDVGSILSGAM